MSAVTSGLILAQALDQAQLVRSVDWHLPEPGWPLAASLAGVVLAVMYIVWLYRRDTVDLSPGWRATLLTLRLAALAMFLGLALNPEERSERISLRPSQVAVLVDTSSSMGNPATDVQATRDSSAPLPSRIEAVQRELASSELLTELRKTHRVQIFGFDSTLSAPLAILERHSAAAVTGAAATGTSASEGAVPAIEDQAAPPANPEWSSLLTASGTETRLGDALVELLTRVPTRTLAGVLVLSDGVSNAGIDAIDAARRVSERQTRVVTGGVGTTEPPANLEVARLLAPSDVQLNDPFQIRAYVRGQNIPAAPVSVELYRSSGEAGGDPARREITVLETQQVLLPEDGSLAELSFTQSPNVAGEARYGVRVVPPSAIRELRQTDNEREADVRVIDKPLRVLLVASGPNWDYRFLRTSLFRNPAVNVDVYLQSGMAGMSQEGDDLLFDFPAARAELFDYDVLVMFDPDLDELSAEQLELLDEWISQQGGGLVYVSGDVFTSRLASVSPAKEQFEPLLPVFLQPVIADFRNENEYSQPWPITWTAQGRAAEMLQIGEDGSSSETAWSQLPGLYRSYPTAGAKASASVYAYHSDPRAVDENGAPILLASQFYGQGKTLFLGSSESYRLRALNPEYFERLWTKIVRSAGQGRLQRGNSRGLFLLESREVPLGQFVPVRVRLVDANYEPLQLPRVQCEVTDPDGKSLVPPLTLAPDDTRPGEYLGSFRTSRAGVYRLRVTVSETGEVIDDSVAVSMPQLELAELRQDVRLLREVARETGGEYLTLTDVAKTFPKLLEDRSEQFLVAEDVHTLWDRQWTMLVFCGLLLLEWTIRKLLRLA